MISIITPCYNAEKYIAKTIESVLNQTYTDWEMLICDDCSTDNSRELVEFYCRKDNRIKLLRTNINTGTPAEPRNIGIQNSKGEYIAFLDSDDIWFPEKLEKQLYFMQTHKYDFVYSNYEKINEEGIRDNRRIIVASKADYKSLLKSCEIPFLTALVRRDVIGCLRFISKPKEDYIFWLQLLKRTNITAYNVNQVLALYRETENSRSSNKFKMIKGQWNILREVEDLSYLYSIFCLSIYLAKGFLKYIK